MGFLGYGAMAGIGQGLNQGTQNLLNFYAFQQRQQQHQQELENLKTFQKAQMGEMGANKLWREQQAADLQHKAQEDAAMRKELIDLYGPHAETGLMSTDGPNVPQGVFSVDPSLDLPKATGRMIPGQPTSQQLMGVLGKYDPKAVLTAQVSMANTEERLKSSEKISKERNRAARKALEAKFESAIKILETKNDFAAQLQLQKLNATLEQIKLRADLRPEKEDKSQQALARAQQSAIRDINMKYAKSLDGQWMKDGVPVPQEKINMEYQLLVKKYLAVDKNKGYSGAGSYINRVLRK